VDGDHVEPGVSLENKERDERFPQGANYCVELPVLCPGMRPWWSRGDAKGERGVVTGSMGH